MKCCSCNYESDIGEEFIAIQGNIGIPDIAPDGSESFGGIIGNNIFTAKDIRYWETHRIKLPRLSGPFSRQLGDGVITTMIYCRKCLEESLNRESIVKSLKIKQKLKLI